MLFGRDTSALRDAAYKVIFDKPSKMSDRVCAAIIYIAIRAGEVIDWWFPVKAIEPLKTN